MDWKNCELRYLNRPKLAEQKINVPESQPYSFVEAGHPNVGDTMRNGLDVKTEFGSPVFTVKNIAEDNRNGISVPIIELEFDHIDPTPYSKVPTDDSKVPADDSKVPIDKVT